VKKGGNETFIKKSKQKFGDRYTYGETVYSGSKTPLSFRCKEHQTLITLTPESHYRSKNGGCKKCFTASYRKDSSYFIEKSKKQFPDKFEYARSRVQPNLGLRK
jgi:hypothetical protein